MLIFNSTFVVTVMPFALCSVLGCTLCLCARCTHIIVIRYECICIWDSKFSAIWVCIWLHRCLSSILKRNRSSELKAESDAVKQRQWSKYVQCERTRNAHYVCSPIKWLLHCKSSLLFLNDLERYKTSNTLKHPITWKTNFTFYGSKNKAIHSLHFEM